MSRHFWISASIAMLVAAFALFAFALPPLYLLDNASGPARDRSFQQLATYSVPPARADAIRDTMNSVLVPLGQASLPTPDRLVVSAPARMQDSIKRAIDSLSEGETAGSNQDAQASVDIWLVEAMPADAVADPRLAMAAEVLEEARGRFGHRQFRLLERLMIVADLNGASARIAGTQVQQAELRLVGRNTGTLEAHATLLITHSRGVGTFVSKLTLPEGQWQLVGLLSDSASTPERLLLMRQTPASSSTGQ
jgi:hypothetical protein